MKKRKTRSQKIRRAVRRHEDRVESGDTKKSRTNRRGTNTNKPAKSSKRTPTNRKTTNQRSKPAKTRITK